MDGYIAQKKCRILEVVYLPGEEVPKSAVPPDLEDRLIKQGYLLSIDFANPQTGEIKVEVPINTKDGVLTLKMTPESIVEAIRIRQLNAEEAAEAVATVESEETLILIDVLDERKTVKSAVRAKVTRNGGTDAEGEGAGGV